MKRFALALASWIATLPAWAGDDGGPAAGPAQYRNPVVAGLYPDPSAIRVGDDFYRGTSTFGYSPSLCAARGHDV